MTIVYVGRPFRGADRRFSGAYRARIGTAKAVPYVRCPTSGALRRLAEREGFRRATSGARRL